jgi:hypothetical protein
VEEEKKMSRFDTKVNQIGKEIIMKESHQFQFFSMKFFDKLLMRKNQVCGNFS